MSHDLMAGLQVTARLAEVDTDCERITRHYRLAGSWKTYIITIQNNVTFSTQLRRDVYLPPDDSTQLRQDVYLPPDDSTQLRQDVYLHPDDSTQLRQDVYLPQMILHN